MNEQELKELWNNVDPEDLPEIDIEEIHKKITGWRSKFRRKLKLELWLSIPGILVFVPAALFEPRIIYYFPLIALLCIWCLWRVWKIYKLETFWADTKNTYEFLSEVTANLTNYIKWMRIIMYSTMPFYALSSLFFNMTVDEVFEYWVGVLFIMVMAEILAIAYCEIYFRIMYFPSIKSARELLKQLETEDSEE